MPGDPLTECPELPVRTVHFRHAPVEGNFLRWLPTHKGDPRATLMLQCDARGREVVEYYDDVLTALIDGRGPAGYELAPGSEQYRHWRIDGRKPTQDELRAMLAKHRERNAEMAAAVVAFWAAEADRRRKARRP